MRSPIVTFMVPCFLVVLPLAWAGLAEEREGEPLFQVSSQCVGCHDGLYLPNGVDASIGRSWSSSMMANAARDPYWQAGVRREVLDHPEAAAVIEGECSRCHMPMSHHLELAAGESPRVLAHLPLSSTSGPLQGFAADGVSCTVCHQVEDQRMGEAESFSGHFVLAVQGRGSRRAYGPFAPDAGLARVMESAVGHRQQEAPHIQKSELCATCHTLFTHAVGHEGPPLPEQVPYLEWRNSDYADAMSCQDCHMPTLPDPAPVASVLGRLHEEVSQHLFRGGNFVLPQIFRRHLEELGVTASHAALEATEAHTRAHLKESAAELSISSVAAEADHLLVSVTVANQAGHKLPSAYPSRRAWLHFKATDSNGTVLLESGRLGEDGAIAGNDNDSDGSAYEPHYETISSADQVQVYEDIMGTPDGKVTTGLLKASQYLKDNRLLPDGFDKENAPAEVAVRGKALTDPDFAGGGDTVRYRLPLPAEGGPVTLRVRLLYQPIGYRWALNLAMYEAVETQRFVRFFKGIASTSFVELASAEATGP
jgi:hypothetical protein